MHSSVFKSFCASFVALLALAVFVGNAEATLITLQPNSSATSVVLQDLISGQVEGVAVGDKVFTNFFYSKLPNDDMPEASDIQIFGFQDVDDNYGISIHGTFLDLPGGGPSDALLRFTVSVSDEGLAQGLRISDAHLFAGGVGLGDNSFFSIDESFQQTSDTLSVFASTLNVPKTQKLSDSVVFAGTHTSLRVTKDIFALAAEGAAQPVRATVIDQSFSQTVIPEPAALSLALAGVMALTVGRRRQRV